MTINNNKYFTFNPHLSNGNESCDNLLIQGDNTPVLQQLAPIFNGLIKCIYIDPPYNNGESYHYYNDSIDHEQWISEMHKILILLKPLLSKDGSIWISIDDSEMAYLKV